MTDTKRQYGRFNQYTCRRCRLRFTSKDINDGVTPFLMPCAYGCGLTAQSAFYRVPPQDVVQVEWYKPSDEEKKRLIDSMLSHVESGGLVFRVVAEKLRPLREAASHQWKHR